MSVLRTQLSGVARRPARLLLTGLAILVASFVVFGTLLAQQITERTVLDTISGTPRATDLVVGDDAGGTSTAVLKKITALPGVAETAGRIDASVSAGSAFLQLSADPGSGPLSVVTVLQGSYPTAANQIAVTARTADRMGLPIGAVTTVRAGKDGKPAELTVTGLVEGPVDFGSTAYAPYGTVMAVSPGDYVQQIDLRLAPGAQIGAVRAAVQAIVDADPVPEGAARPIVRTGADTRTDEANAVSADLDVLFAVVGMFVAIAVIAAALVATSTFRIVFAQRMRQLALLRAVGAGRGAIVRALAAEGALTGFVAGLVGVLAALALGHALPPILRGFGLAVSSPGLPIAGAAAVVLLAVLITTIAVLAPAVSAARVSPLEALRASSTTGGRRDIGVPRWVLGLLLAAGAAGIAVFVLTRLPKPDTVDYDPAPMLLGVVGSGALAFFALVALGPVIVRPVLRAVGWPLRQAGPVGRLAVGGVGGAPRRAAAVSVVVALGVTLIAGVIVGGASVRVLLERELAISAPADFELTAPADDTIAAATVEQARTRPELTHVTPYRRVLEVGLDSLTVGTVEVNDLDLVALPALAAVDVSSGSLADAGPGKAVIADYVVRDTNLAVGDPATLTVNGRTVTVTVAAILRGPTPLYSGMVLHPSDLDSLGAPAGYSGILADAAVTGEQGRTAAQQALQQLAGPRGAGWGLEVLADRRDENDKALDTVLGVAIGLISLTVLIAVVGVGTTTALSVVERVRESGLLRAVGLSRGGLRGMLTTESSLYGVIGASIGLLLGIPYAWLAVEALGVDAPLELPVLQLAGVFLALVLCTALAGVLPARRASRVSPVAALATDG